MKPLDSTADRIAAAHGCEFQPTTTPGKVALQVLRRYQPHADEALASCKRALVAAGYDLAEVAS